MQTQSRTASPAWVELAGAETIEKVAAALRADPDFLAEAQQDLNGAVERRMGLSFPVPLHLEMDGDVAKIWPKNATSAAIGAPGELTDADLDLVAGGSMRICDGLEDPNCK